VARSNEDWVANRILAGAGDGLFAAARPGHAGFGRRDVVVLDAAAGALLVLEVRGWDYAALAGTEKDEKYWHVNGLGRRRNPLKRAERGVIALIESLPGPLKPRRQDQRTLGDYIWLAGVAFPNLSRARAADLGLFCPRLLPDGCPYLWQEDVGGDTAPALGRAVRDCLSRYGWQPVPLSVGYAELLWGKVFPNEPVRYSRPSSELEPEEGPSPGVSRGVPSGWGPEPAPAPTDAPPKPARGAGIVDDYRYRTE
jgi:hypothetical protein